MHRMHPPKPQVRKQRARESSPPPSREQTRRELGWELVPANGPAREVPK